MNEDVLSFKKIKINKDLLDEIWELDPKSLDKLDGVVVSSYAMCLSQYLIYFTYQRNITKAEVHELTRNIDRSVTLTLASGDVDTKKFKTKAAGFDYVISMDTELMDMQTKLEASQKELRYIEGIDKQVSELIATLKRELTRRENELYRIRQERH